MTKPIDLRSDTVTKPTPEMWKAMANADVGDDVYREDPTVNRLQERAAAAFEREAALFVPTGTMGNQIAVKLHTRPGQEVITESNSHVFNYEMATMAAFSGCLARPVTTRSGQLAWSDISPHIAPGLYYRAQTGLITLENTHNFGGGTFYTSAQVLEITSRAHENRLPVHMDGARIFNAAAATGETVSRLTGGCDSVMFCLSKGLCAPVGSLLVGSKALIEQAWSVRKMMGGGMRQVGVLAAAGLIALEKMSKRLHEDHENARLLAEALVELEGFEVDLERVHTNIVMAELRASTSEKMLEQLRANGILVGWAGPGHLRFVTHNDVSRADIAETIRVLRDLDAC